LFNFEPPATDEEVRAASLQFVRKLSGFAQPSQQNERVFARAVADVYKIARRMIDTLVTTAPPRDREVEAAKARERNAVRFGTSGPSRSGPLTGRRRSARSGRGRSATARTG
jgi:hypothetical protein